MSDTDPADDDTVVRPFADWLREQSTGKSHDELSEGLHDLIGRVRDTGKKGTLTFTVSVAPLKGDRDVLVVSDEIRLKLPEHDRKASLFYPDKFGNLSRTDPNQLTFEGLREVGGGMAVDVKTGELKELTK
jgi:hypothetical protein